MKNSLTLTLLFILYFTACTFGQKNRYVRVFLKDGSVRKGTLLEEQPAVRLETFDKSILTFQTDEVDKI